MANNLEDLLEAVSVHEPDQWENTDGPEGWWAVSTDEAGGIIAYFAQEAAAYWFRLALINAALNELSMEGNSSQVSSCRRTTHHEATALFNKLEEIANDLPGSGS